MADANASASVPSWQCFDQLLCPNVNTTTESATGGQSLLETNLELYGEVTFDAVATYLLLVAVVGTITNVLILVIYPKHRSVQSPLNLLFVNLAVSDLIVAIAGSFAQFLTTALRVEAKAGTTICNGYGFVMFAAGMASLNSLTVISFERYLTVVRPFGIGSLTYRGAYAAVVGIWFVAFIYAVGPLGLYGTYIPEGLGTWCSVDFEDADGRIYVICIFTFGFFLPVGVIVFSYSAVWWKVKQVATTNAGASTAAKAERTVALAASAMVFCFLLAWTPYAVVSMMVAWGSSEIPHYATTIPSLLAKSSMCYNPILYVGLNQKFRAAIIETCFPSGIPFSTATGTGVATLQVTVGGATNRVAPQS